VLLAGIFGFAYLLKSSVAVANTTTVTTTSDSYLCCETITQFTTQVNTVTDPPSDSLVSVDRQLFVYVGNATSQYCVTNAVLKIYNSSGGWVEKGYTNSTGRYISATKFASGETIYVTVLVNNVWHSASVVVPEMTWVDAMSSSYNPVSVYVR
jgi:hypothetical protein